ncbi:hypothetical protein [Corallococcus sp. EGB]|uniref:hypothetical protein n=1 Tax=Corallococcus sp. EGB TaxID=1521117 RepID=UPI001CBE5FC9|nr:hypothetical protein [Corallococcus sp. EGB]
MSGFVKRTGQSLLAVVAGTALSFSATQALAPVPEAPARYERSACIAQCIELNYSYGYCNRTECYCY